MKILFAASLYLSVEAQTAPTVYTVLDLPDARGAPLRRPVGPIHAGFMSIRLEHTTLTQVQKRFGGRVRNGGEASNAVAWLCYRSTNADATPLIYWFDSNSEMSSGLRISEVAVQLAPPASVRASCDEAPSSLTGVSSGLPGIDATRNDLFQRFGPIEADAKGFLVYSHERPLPRRCTTLDVVTYRIENDGVKLFAVPQVSSC